MPVRSTVSRQAVNTALLALFVLLPFLGSFGFWDPQEIAVADKARSLFVHGGYLTMWKTQLPLVPWLVATSVANLGQTEFAARLPVALLGLIAALATYGLGARLRRPRAGLIAAVALLSSPLFLFQARQLTSDIGVVAGQALAMLGLVGLAWPSGRPRLRDRILDGVYVTVGLLLGLLAGGLVLGVLAPVAAAAAAALALSPAAGEARRRTRTFAWIAGGATLLLCVVTLRTIFHLAPAQPGARALFGKMLVASPGYLPLLGGAWRVGPAPPQAAFDWIVNQVAFGMFPWSALAPIAVLRFVFVRDRDRASWGGIVAVVWATVAYLLSAVWVRAVGDVRFPGLAAIALAIGLFLDEVMERKLEGGDSEGMPVGALFVFMAAFILSLDLRQFPDRLAALPVLNGSVKFPPQLFAMVIVVILFGIAFGASAAVGLFVRGDGGRVFGRHGLERRKLARAGLLGAVGTGTVFALFLSFVWTPRLSQHLSYKDLFQSYFRHRHGSEPLAVMGIPGSGPEYYARGKFKRFDTIPPMLGFLRSRERTFAIVPSDRMCQIHFANASEKVDYHVIDTSNSRFYLFTNKLDDGERDVNPLLTFFRKQPPGNVARKISANFEDTVELLGVDMPDRVHKGDRFKVTLWFKVKKRFTENKMIFMHFDSMASGVRFQGDHHPVGCPTTYWRPGDIISDTYEVVAGGLTHPTGGYRVWFGFTIGGGDQWRNMKVVSGPKDVSNRVPLGILRVD